MDLYIRIKFRITLMLVFGICLAISLEPIAHAGLYLDDEIASISKTIKSLTSKLKRCEAEIRALKRIRRSTVDDEASNQALRVRLEEEKIDLEAKVEELEFKLKYFQSKRELFPKAFLGEHCEIYFHSIADPTSYDQEVRKVFDTFSSMFPGLPSFTFSRGEKKIQILIYKNRNDFVNYEEKLALFEQPLTKSRFICDRGIISEKKEFLGSRRFMIALVEKKSLHELRHCLTHHCISEGLSIEARHSVEKGNLFLNEGLAELIANKLGGNGPETFLETLSNNQELTASSSHYSQNTFNNSQFLSSDADTLKTRFAESAYFVYWLTTLDRGMSLYRQIVGVEKERVEFLINSNQISRGVPASGFMEYVTWKKLKLDELKGPWKPSSE